MIKIDIELKKRSHAKELFHKLHSTSEDLLFKLIMKPPENFISRSVMEWLDRYTNKRIRQLEMQNIKQNWRNMYLQKAIGDISNRQQQS